MVDLILNLDSIALQDGLEIDKYSSLNSNYYNLVTFFNQDEMNLTSNLKIKGVIDSFSHTSFVWFEPEIKKSQMSNEKDDILFRSKIIKLQVDLGNDLFDQLSLDHILLLINTAGVIKAGQINIDEVYDFIKG